MPKTQAFEEHVGRYEEWFVRNRFAHESELEAIKGLLPETGMGIEIGVGTGRFAAPLGIGLGLKPAKAMREVTQGRGIEVVNGVAEALPFADTRFDFALMVTTICFLDDIEAAFREACRVLKAGGALAIDFLDRDSPIGRTYQAA